MSKSPSLFRVTSAGVLTAAAGVGGGAAGNLARQGSLMFFAQESSDTPVYKRGIFWVFSIFSTVGVAIMAWQLSIYVNSELSAITPGGENQYFVVTAPPTITLSPTTMSPTLSAG